MILLIAYRHLRLAMTVRPLYRLAGARA